MSLVDKATLVLHLAPPLDPNLTTALVEEFISLEHRFIQRDWEPAQLDGGQFCEVLGRILYHQDSGTLNPTKDFNECVKFIWDEKNQHKHLMAMDHSIHLSKVLRTTYNVRH